MHYILTHFACVFKSKSALFAIFGVLSKKQDSFCDFTLVLRHFLTVLLAMLPKITVFTSQTQKDALPCGVCVNNAFPSGRRHLECEQCGYTMPLTLGEVAA